MLHVTTNYSFYVKSPYNVLSMAVGVHCGPMQWHGIVWWLLGKWNILLVNESEINVQRPNQSNDFYTYYLHKLSPSPKFSCIVLLEYFTGEKPLQMSQISRKFDPLRSNCCVLARIVCTFTCTNNLCFDCCELVNHRKVCKCLIL